MNMTKKLLFSVLKKLFIYRQHHQTYYIMNRKGKIFSENLTRKQGLLTLNKLKIQYPKDKFYLEMKLPIF